MDKATIISEHIREKDSSSKFKERRYSQWNENYSLYRDKVSTNRLTQRQPINVPIARETLAYWISKIDEPPKILFESRDSDKASKDAEIVFNEVYKYYYNKNKLDILDNMSKKTVGLQGRCFIKLSIINGEPVFDLLDPYDIEIDPRTNPLDLNTSSYFIQTHIYKSLKEILASKKYSAEGKKELSVFLGSERGILKIKETEDSYQAKKERMEKLGVTNFDEYCSSDVLVELNESYKMVWDSEKNQFVRHIITIAMDSVVLSDVEIEEGIGIDKLPIVTWASDPDIVDFWSDGIVDNVRTYNKLVNIYLSQDIENRTYRNFGMYFYNTLNNTFQPRAFEAKPFGFYGVPGNPNDIITPVRIEPLSDTANQITWLKNQIQSSVAQTPAERGIKEAGEQTLGQIQLSLQKTAQVNQVVSKNYRRAWEELGLLFYQMMNKNSKGVLTLYKKNRDGDYDSKDIYPSSWKTPNGYEVRVLNEVEKSAVDDFDLKKIQYLKNSFANNTTAIMLAKKKELELMNMFTEAEIDSIMTAEGPNPLNVNQNAPSIVNNPQDSIKNSNANVLK